MKEYLVYSCLVSENCHLKFKITSEKSRKKRDENFRIRRKWNEIQDRTVDVWWSMAVELW